MTVARGALAALLVLGALSGCASTMSPPAAGFSDAERADYAERAADRLWRSSPLADQRPEGITPVMVDSGEWGATVLQCLTDAGFDGYTLLGGSISWQGASLSHDEQLAQLVCFSSYAQDPAEVGVLNSAQLGYLYDYYREVTVPCLVMAGVTVVDAPTKAEFVESGVGWRPDVSALALPVDGVELGHSPWYRSTAGTPVEERCPSWPPEWDLEQG